MFSTRPLLIFTPKIPALELRSPSSSFCSIDIYLLLSSSATHLCLNSREFFPHQPARLTAATLATHSLVCSATFTALNTELRHLTSSTARLTAAGPLIDFPRRATHCPGRPSSITSARLFSPNSVERRILQRLRVRHRV